jgi:pSer/pThr/pTyr-binding forkhead associated (FHA) protein
VALSESAATEFHRAFGTAAAALPEVARSLAASSPAQIEDPAVEATLNLRSAEAMHLLAGAEPRHHLVILQPESAVRRVALPQGSLTIGRALPSTLLLDAAEVSRAHCRIDVAGDDVTITDLNSTNGTVVDNKRLTGTAPLPHGALLRIGNYVLTCEYESVLQALEADSTRRASYAEVTVLRPRRTRSS